MKKDFIVDGGCVCLAVIRELLCSYSGSSLLHSKSEMGYAENNT